MGGPDTSGAKHVGGGVLRCDVPVLAPSGLKESRRRPRGSGALPAAEASRPPRLAPEVHQLVAAPRAASRRNTGRAACTPRVIARPHRPHSTEAATGPAA